MFFFDLRIIRIDNYMFKCFFPSLLILELKLSLLFRSATGVFTREKSGISRVRDNHLLDTFNFDY